MYHCIRLISMAFLSAEHDKCIWEIKCCGWVVDVGSWMGAITYSNILKLGVMLLDSGSFNPGF